MRVSSTPGIILTTDRDEFLGGRAVNWSFLLKHVQNVVTTQGKASDASTSRAAQKRRALASDGAPIKKRKLIFGAATNMPTLSPNTYPVFCEQYRIKYQHEAGDEAWVEDIEHLTSFLREHFYDQDEDVFMELGPCSVRIRDTYKGGRVDLTGAGDGLPDTNYLSIRPFPNDSTSGQLFGWLKTLELATSYDRCYSLSAKSSLVVQAHSTFEKSNYLPFEVHIDFTLSFIAPFIFNEPQARVTRDSRTVADIRSCLLQLAFPVAPLDSSLEAAYHGRVDIPFFYAAIKSAPPLSSELAFVRAQPECLLASLLPFQRRTVAWLLEKEGKRITDSGDIADISSLSKEQSLPLLWDRVKVTDPSEEDAVWYYHRLKATLTPDFPTEDRPRPGAILAEEPGLGKTIECISLVLHNPGEGRNPSTSRWDAKAELDVKVVKVRSLLFSHVL
jgi:hypothetical protein